MFSRIVRVAALSVVVFGGSAMALSPPPSATAPSPEPVGVPECDNFLKAYDACLADKVPEAQRAQFAASINQVRDAWRQAAQTPQARAAMGPQCIQVAQTMKQSLAAYNCDF